jgi:hypothetical protein
MGGYHHWDREGEIERKGREKEKIKICSALFEEPPEDWHAMFLGDLLDEVPKKAKKASIRFIRKRIVYCAKYCAKSYNDFVKAADYAESFDYRTEARRLYRKAVQIFCQKLRTESSFGDEVISTDIANMLRSVDRGEYSQKKINEMCSLIIKVLKGVKYGRWRDEYVPIIEKGIKKGSIAKGKMKNIYAIRRLVK